MNNKGRSLKKSLDKLSIAKKSSRLIGAMWVYISVVYSYKNQMACILVPIDISHESKKKCTI